MSAVLQDQSSPKFLASLDELTRALDHLAIPSVPPPSRAIPIADERLAFDPPPARQRYQFTSWAKRWRDGPPQLPAGRRTPLERWPLVMGLGGLLWLAMTGVMVAGWKMSQPPGYEESALLPPPGVEEVQGAVGAALDPNEELAATVEDLQAGTAQKSPGSRAPRILTPLAVSQRPTDCLGTTVKFVDGAAEAALQAKSNRKLMMLLNVSGDFDDTRFT